LVKLKDALESRCFVFLLKKIFEKIGRQEMIKTESNQSVVGERGKERERVGERVRVYDLKIGSEGSDVKGK